MWIREFRSVCGYNFIFSTFVDGVAKQYVYNKRNQEILQTWHTSAVTAAAARWIAASTALMRSAAAAAADSSDERRGSKAARRDCACVSVEWRECEKRDSECVSVEGV